MEQELMAGQVDGFGESSLAELAELRKALDIGYTQPTTGVGFDALRVESLESTLKLLTFSSSHIRFWQAIAKLDAYSTVEEYNRLLEYGQEAGGFVASGALPETEDSTYERADQKVKYCGTTREVNHPATLVRTVPADLIAQETQNGVLWLLGKINRALYEGDASVIPLEWNGVMQQIVAGSGTIVDLRGQPISKDDIENSAQYIVDNFGIPTKVFSNPKVFTDFSKTAYPMQRFNTPGAGGVVGTPIRGYNTLIGQIDFEPDVFVRRGGVVPAAAATKAPSAPTVTPSLPGATVGSLFGAADAGNYKYQVTAINAFGESLPCTITAAQAIVAGAACSLSIADGAGTYPATGYKIYRTEKGGLVTYFIGYFLARYKSGGVYSSPTVFVDLNTYLPRCFQGLMLDMSTQSLSFKQLSPMIKMPLAVVAPSIRWMQLLYGTPIVYAPKKNVVLRNIGVQS